MPGPHSRVAQGNPLSAARVQAFAARTLDFLQLIEKTVSNLTSDAELLGVHARDIRRLIVRLGENTHARDIDPEGVVCDLLHKAAGMAAHLHAEHAARLDSARSDSGLDEDDGVVEAFEAIVAALTDIHDATEDLRDTIATLDALRSPKVGPTYSDVDALLADAMKA